MDPITIITNLVQSEGLGESKAPASLEGPPDHRGRGGGRGRGQAEGVGEPHATDVHREVHSVDVGVEVGQGRLSGDAEALGALGEGA